MSIHPLNVYGIGCFTGPVNVAAIGIQAKVMKLVICRLDSAAYDHGRLEANKKGGYFFIQIIQSFMLTTLQHQIY